MPINAPIITIPIGKNPAPNNVNIGPGHAPTNAQPNPKQIPPIRICDRK